MNKDTTLKEIVTEEEASSSVTIFVCTSCGDLAGSDDLRRSDGMRLFSDLEALTATTIGINISPVDCLAVCEKSVTIAFSSSHKWTYIIGDVDHKRDLDDIVSMARTIAKSPSGVPAMKDRPPFFRKGVVSRLPPLPFSSDLLL